MYGEGVTPTKAESSQRSDRAATRMFLDFFGPDRSPAPLSRRDWDRFIRARRAGRVGASDRPVSDRTIEHEKTGYEHRTPVTDEALAVLRKRGQ